MRVSRICHAKYVASVEELFAKGQYKMSNNEKIRVDYYWDDDGGGKNCLEKHACLLLSRSSAPTPLNALRGNHEATAWNKVVGFLKR